MSWEGRKQWRFWKKRGAELRRRKEESERLESEKLESGLGEGIVDEKVGLEGEKMETAVEVVPAGSDEREREGREEVSSSRFFLQMRFRLLTAPLGPGYVSAL